MVDAEPDSGSWVRDKSQSFDKVGARRATTDQDFVGLVKNSVELREGQHVSDREADSEEWSMAFIRVTRRPCEMWCNWGRRMMPGSPLTYSRSDRAVVPVQP